LTAFLIFLSFVVGIVAGYFAIIHRPRRKRFLASAEYWVYLPGDEMPDQNAVMTRTIGMNPYHHRSRPAIDTKEGLLFSDVRTHFALVLRKKNPHAFRPDLFDSCTEVSAEALDALAQAHSFVKVRFISEDRLKDARHLQFLPHAADAVAELGEGRLIYDVTAERLILRDELEATLRTKADVSGPDVHARVIWRPEIEAGHAETRGLVKVGHRELRTPSTPTDQRILVVLVLEEVIRQLWQAPTLPETLEVAAFDDRFRVLFEPGRDAFTKVRILRLRSV
jgi:hypothetical protein